MEAKHLRIGNFVRADEDGMIYRVSGILGSHVQAIPLVTASNGDGFQFESIEGAAVMPIGLTVDWLIDLGFGQDDDSFHLKGYNLWVRYVRGAFKISSGHDTLREISYVHELQNIYFTIARVELCLG